MQIFNEHSLEMAIMELFQNENYEYISGDMIQRKQTEVLLENDIKSYLKDKYASENLTEN